MKHRILFIVFVLLPFCCTSYAQEADSTVVILSQVAPTATALSTETDCQYTDSLAFYKSYFDNSDILVRSYNFELINKKKRLNMWSNEVTIFGFTALFGIISLGSWLGVNNDWSVWVTVPVETVVGIGTLWGFIAWGNNLKKRSDAILVADVPVYLWKGSRLYASHFTTSFNHKHQGIGLSYHFTF